MWAKIQSLCIRQSDVINVPPLQDSTWAYNAPSGSGNLCQMQRGLVQSHGESAASVAWFGVVTDRAKAAALGANTAMLVHGLSEERLESRLR